MFLYTGCLPNLQDLFPDFSLTCSPLSLIAVQGITDAWTCDFPDISLIFPKWHLPPDFSLNFSCKMDFHDSSLISLMWQIRNKRHYYNSSRKGFAIFRGPVVLYGVLFGAHHILGQTTSCHEHMECTFFQNKKVTSWPFLPLIWSIITISRLTVGERILFELRHPTSMLIR